MGEAIQGGAGQRTIDGMESSDQLHPASCPHTILGIVHLLHPARSPLLRVATTLEQHLPAREGADAISRILEDEGIYDVDVIYTPER